MIFFPIKIISNIKAYSRRHLKVSAVGELALFWTAWQPRSNYQRRSAVAHQTYLIWSTIMSCALFCPTQKREREIIKYTLNRRVFKHDRSMIKFQANIKSEKPVCQIKEQFVFIWTDFDLKLCTSDAPSFFFWMIMFKGLVPVFIGKGGKNCHTHRKICNISCYTVRKILLQIVLPKN